MKKEARGVIYKNGVTIKYDNRRITVYQNPVDNSFIIQLRRMVSPEVGDVTNKTVEVIQHRNMVQSTFGISREALHMLAEALNRFIIADLDKPSIEPSIDPQKK